MPTPDTAPLNDDASADETLVAPEVFISYARADRARAEAIASALQTEGLKLWWDRQIEGGQDFADAIAAQLAAARLVLALWSATSVKSGFVRDEAGRARDAGKLLPVNIDEVLPPLGFGTLQTLPLLNWDGDTARADWQALRGAVLTAVRRGPGGLNQPGGVGPRANPGAGVPPWKRPAVLALLAIALSGGGLYGVSAWNRQQNQTQAQALLSDGLAAQFGRDPNLEVARNAYFSALQRDPALGRAHYHLGQIYALLSLRSDALPSLRVEARTHYSDALRLQGDLLPDQIEDSRLQLAALGEGAQDLPLVRDAAAVALASASAPTGANAPQPASAVAAAASASATGDKPPRVVFTGSSGRRPASVGGDGPDIDALLAAKPPGAGPGGVLRIPFLPLDAASQADIDARVAALFGAEAPARAAAASALALSPERVSDALPLAIARSLRGLRDEPGSEAVASGVAATLQLMQGASPATLARNRDDALRLLDAAAALGTNTLATAEVLRQRLAALGPGDDPRQAPLAYLQIANPAQLPIAQALAERLRKAGYRVPAIEDLSRKPGVRRPQQTELRVQGASDQALARWLLKVTGQAVGVPVKSAALRSAKPATDTFEIWFDTELCAPGGRTATGCAP